MQACRAEATQTRNFRLELMGIVPNPRFGELWSY